MNAACDCVCGSDCDGKPLPECTSVKKCSENKACSCPKGTYWHVGLKVCLKAVAEYCPCQMEGKFMGTGVLLKQCSAFQFMKLVHEFEILMICRLGN